ncbi:TRAP-type C4-dicarboxylate transport system, small permease component [Tistlia consotensis]|uniref:TRAP transporter small permease protein n=1 Tax=Tistlia consotensis USBA 355 TaxID=560819 RepID=A0A1Y6BFE3_9PROT|nr:TRAP transporter small permease subunit [Tistlia consotensis]SME98642.1 TRAP-type C4-dicarboxylate transport system, small permease component [Tistlia consotensis USBA 355]SNR58024.1 TRAP-type C4-dicarboxylate transport system, small permease component [Tistlia consotensis]
MTFETVLRVYRTTMKALLVALIAVLLGVMTLQIVMRYGFNGSLIWAEELCRYLLIWVSLLAGSLAYERGEIAAVTLLRDALPRRGALCLATLANLAAAVLCGVLVHYGLRYAALVGAQPIPALRFLFQDSFGWAAWTVPPVYWVYVALPLGMGLLGLRLLLDAGRYGLLLKRGGSVDDLYGGAPAELPE